MDPALLRERERFLKRSLAAPVIEKKKQPVLNKQETSSRNDSFKKKQKSVSSVPRLDYRSVGPSSQNKFSILAKIITYMKKRYLEGEDYPLSLDEIIDETQQLDIDNKLKTWLNVDALRNNPKIEVTIDDKFSYKPPLKIRNKTAFLKLLKLHDLKGLGGLLLDEIQESLPRCDKIMKIVENEIIVIERPDKKKIIFYNDKTANLSIDEDFQKLWRLAAVDGMDDKNVEEYLDKNGINSMQDTRPKVAPIKRKRANNKRKTLKKPRDNEHLEGILENYDENK